MKSNNGKRLSFLFYSLSFLSLVISCLPKRYVMSVYTPSILGYIFLILLLVVIILFIYLFIRDIKINRYKQILERIIVIILGILIYHMVRNYWL